MVRTQVVKIRNKLFDSLRGPPLFWSLAAFTENDIREYAQKLPHMIWLFRIKPEGIKGFLNGSVVFPNDSVVIVKRQGYGARKIWIQKKRSSGERIVVWPLLVFELFSVETLRAFIPRHMIFALAGLVDAQLGFHRRSMLSARAMICRT